MDHHQLVTWYRKSCTDPQLKDLKRLALLVKETDLKIWVKCLEWLLLVCRFTSGWCVYPPVFFRNNSLCDVFFEASKWIMSFNQVCMFFSRVFHNKLVHFPSWLTGFFSVLQTNHQNPNGFEGRDASLARSTSESQWKVSRDWPVDPWLFLMYVGGWNPVHLYSTYIGITIIKRLYRDHNI